MSAEPYVPEPWLGDEFPLIWSLSIQADHDERLGREVQPLDAECAAVLRELWLARGGRTP